MISLARAPWGPSDSCGSDVATGGGGGGGVVRRGGGEGGGGEEGEEKEEEKEVRLLLLFLLLSFPLALWLPRFPILPLSSVFGALRFQVCRLWRGRAEHTGCSRKSIQNLKFSHMLSHRSLLSSSVLALSVKR